CIKYFDSKLFFSNYIRGDLSLDGVIPTWPADKRGQIIGMMDAKTGKFMSYDLISTNNNTNIRNSTLYVDTNGLWINLTAAGDIILSNGSTLTRTPAGRDNFTIHYLFQK